MTPFNHYSNPWGFFYIDEISKVFFYIQFNIRLMFKSNIYLKKEMILNMKLETELRFP